MLCERCKKKESTVHLTEIIKSVRSEVHLCESCAREIGLNSKLSSYAVSVPDMVSFLDDGTDGAPEGGVCRFCGTSSADIEAGGRAGCPRCYETISGVLASVYPELKIPYTGKRPAEKNGASPEPDSKEDTTSLLIEQLDDAVKEERYEEAARLRDMIRGRR